MRLADSVLQSWLSEDAPFGDLTTQSLGIGTAPGHMSFAARNAMVLALAPEAARLLELAGAKVEMLAGDGSHLAAGDIILTATGRAQALLLGWKVAQTLLEMASGMASSAAAIVAAAHAVDSRITVACTRKSFPGTRAVAVKAIIAGGAVPHRLGLSETVLVFAEHLAFTGHRPLSGVVAELKQRCPEKKIVMEVADLDTALSAAQAGVDVLQLEKFTPSQVAEAAHALADWPGTLAAAGGVNAANASDYVRAGARVLVTSAPYWAPPKDVAVKIGV
ncbi:ModD protein [Magnetospirillum gryphiswaldense]|uniref:Putative pyrophosphorylase ModD n=1 Tax=Magnetospirillum gryphiswaldense TaxID=55518 RepID=A4TX54_9PROT|nr:ModD protein [Magnetospirillum gryphiswaldense]AVM74510.1 Nicotinate-nucleotide pyrophosphorylase [carboxylating] [Magnetospirillum gryphiswaldense MSR-1]AVM78413.1 Nicotinate-nucleotide pyrophosphorylase [carboxylating] [Magnetospirillum gryphiswaldense]CAM75211.1 molybdenum utilization protein ModD [Magnetospirillum gryphiswaldense MSR-1]